MTESDLMTLPISPRAFWVLVWLLGLLTACVVIYFALPATRQRDTPWVRYKKYTGLIKVPEPLPELILLIWITILALLIAGLGWTIAKTAFGAIPNGETATTALFRLAGLTGVTGAVVAFPFTILRTHYNQRQTDAAEAALVNDKLNAAFAGLSARRTVTSRSREVVYMLNDTECTTTETPEDLFELPKGATLIRSGPWQVISEEEDDIVTRSTAIDRLEGLAVEEPDQVARIVSILSLYVRELSREYPAKEAPEESLGVLAIQEWTNTLIPARPDMEKAAQTLGRLPDIVKGYGHLTIRLDLSAANLQRFDLSGLNFEGADMEWTNLQGADLSYTRLSKSNLCNAKLDGVNLHSSQLESTHLCGAQFIGAFLSLANFTQADLFQACFWGAQTHRIRLSGASVFACHFGETNIATDALAMALGDCSTILPAKVAPPLHWPRRKTLDYSREWRRFKEDPDAYTPPDPPKDAAET